MTLVRLEGYTAPERDTGTWTSVRVERAASYAGPWPGTIVTVESVSYTDPHQPPTLGWTFDDPDGQGFYRVVWSAPGVGADPPQEADAPVVEALVWERTWPTVGEIALILRARLVELGGGRVESFTSSTEPTSEEVASIIALYAPLMMAGLGDLDTLACSRAGSLRGAARALIAQRVATEVELSYRPEEVGQSAAAAIAERRDSMDTDLARLITAVEACRDQGASGGDDSGSVGRADAAWSFPRVPYLNW